MNESISAAQARARKIGLLAGPAFALALLLFIPESALTTPGRVTLGLLALMAVWWLTEAIDISATALLPLAILPLGTYGAFDSGGAAMRTAAAPYANPFIVLFLGGFLLALSMQRWGLHRRIALSALRFAGTQPRGIVAAVMGVTAVMSMWVSNTASAMMMIPIALSIIQVHHDSAEGESDRDARRFGLCMILGVAYAASVGGIGTLIGTPPNLILAGFLQETYGQRISFARWLLVGLPLVAVFVPIIWLVLTRVVYPLRVEPEEGTKHVIEEQRRALGPMKLGEWVTMLVFLGVAFCWIFRPIISSGWTTTGDDGAERVIIPALVPGLTDAGIAAIGALLLFVIPVKLGREIEFTMDWKSTAKLPWGVLILFGGGLSLADAVRRHGVADFLGNQAEILAGLPTLLILLTIIAAVIFLTEMTSNTATTAALLPILAALAPTLGIEPILLLAPTAIAASCAFMMPIATPPNAVAFGSGMVTIPEMCKAGLWLNLIGIVLVTVTAYALAGPLLASV